MVEFPVHDKARKCDGSKIADGHFIGGGVLHDLCAKVRTFDGAEIFLIGFAVYITLLTLKKKTNLLDVKGR